MKKLRIFLGMLILAVILSAYCGGNAAYADEQNEKYFYYGIDENRDALELDFRSGLNVVLEDLQGYADAEIKLIVGDREYSSKLSEVDSDGGRAILPLQDIFEKLKNKEEAQMEICVNTSDDESIILWKGTICNLYPVPETEADETKVKELPPSEAPETYVFRFVTITGSNPDNKDQLWLVKSNRISLTTGSKSQHVKIKVGSAEYETSSIYNDGWCNLRLDKPLADGDVVIVEVYDGENILLQRLKYTVREKQQAQEPEVILNLSTKEQNINGDPDRFDPEATPVIQQTEKTTAEPTLDPTPTAEPTPESTSTAETALEITPEATAELSEDVDADADAAMAETGFESVPNPVELPMEQEIAEDTPIVPPEIAVMLVVGDEKYPFVKLGEGEENLLYISSADNAEIVSEIEPDDNEKDFHWTLTYGEEGRNPNEITKDGEFNVRGHLDKENVVYKFTASYSWKDFEDSFELYVIVDSLGIRLLKAENPDEAIESGDILAEQAIAMLVCCAKDNEPKVSVNGQEAALEQVELEGKEGCAVYHFIPNTVDADFLDIVVTDERGNEKAYALTIDPAPAIELNNVEVALDEQIAGKTETEADLVLMQGEEVFVEAKADALGMFSFAMPEEVKVGDILLVRASDAVGNVCVQEIIVTEDRVKPLALDDAEAVFVVFAANAEEGIRVTGTGEPKIRLKAYIHGKEDPIDTQIKDDGSWHVDLTAADFGDIQGEYAVHIREMYNEENGLDFKVILDTSCTLTINELVEGKQEITGTADPGARIIIYIKDKDEEITQEIIAGEDGQFSNKTMMPLRAGMKLKGTAVDVHGNESEAVEAEILARKAEKISIEAQQEKDLIRIMGTAEADYTVEICLGEDVLSTATADAEGVFETTISVDKVDTGEISIVASYEDEGLEQFASEALILYVDTEGPEIQLNQKEINTDSFLISGMSSEPADICVLADGKMIAEVHTREDLSFEIQLDPQEMGTVMTVTAKDAFGNEGETEFEFVVTAAREILIVVDTPVRGEALSYMEPIRIAGRVFASHEISKLKLLVGDADMEIQPDTVQEISAEDAKGFSKWVDAQYCVSFELYADASGWKLGQNELQAFAGEKPVDLLQAEGENKPVQELYIQLEKPGDYLPKRVFVLVVILLGIIICIIILRRVSVKIRIYHDAELDSVNKSRLTIRRRDND